MLQITGETREQIRAASALENDRLLLMDGLAERVAHRRAEAERKRQEKKARWRR